jgi:putative oxidoreductase
MAYAPHMSGRDRAVDRYARLALGGAFLSAVAGRFGLWSGAPWAEAFGRFVGYTAEVNAFMPAAAVPWLAWAATAAEVTLGSALVLGLRVRETAIGSAILLAIFGTAMAISFGPKSPLDYSVFSASACALLLASRQPRSPGAAR